MVEIQRARMLVAMVEVCAEHGPANVTVAGVVERAGVSRRTFYEIFDDCEDCLLAALDEGLRRASERVLPAYRGGGRWSERIRSVSGGVARIPRRRAGHGSVVDRRVARGGSPRRSSVAAGARANHRRGGRRARGSPKDQATTSA